VLNKEFSIFTSSKLEVRKSKLHGVGVFAKEEIEEGEIIERQLAVPFATDSIEALIHQDHCRHILCDYAFSVPETDYSCIVMGLAMVYNHENLPNTTYRWIGTPLDQTFLCEFFSLQKIKKDEEITHRYGPNVEFSSDGGWKHLSDPRVQP